MSNDNFDTLDNTPTIPGEPGGQILSGRYKIVREVGSGGMGTVYLAQDSELDIEVAIKVLPTLLANNKRAIDNLRREAKTALKLSHPNIVRLHTFQSDEAIKYLVMEYVDGGNLEERILAAGALSVEETLKTFTHVAAGLDYAHSQNVLHRDIKPANIMLTKDGNAKLADFGIARQLKESMTRITGKETSGTLLYMAPEQFRGGEPDHRSDIYSLAASIYECLSGHPPFWRGSIEYQVMNERPAPLEKLSDEQNAAVLKALSKEANDRQSNAKELLAELGADPAILIWQPSVRPGEQQSRKDTLDYAKTINVKADKKVREVSLTDVVPVKTNAEMLWKKIKSSDGIGKFGDLLNEVEIAFTNAETFYEEKAYSEALSYYNDVIKKCENIQTLQEKRKSTPEKELIVHLGAGVEMNFVYIPAGEFMMGSPSKDKTGSGDEGPQHKVTISKGFYMSVYEVTQQQYEAIMNNNPSYFKGENLPVEKVSWNDATEFCRKLGQKEGKTYRLPTEAEWEYACRAGTTAPFNTGQTISTDQANYDGNYVYGSGRKGTYRQKTTTVGSFQPNAFGLYDMHGNVWEWCSDWYDGNYYSRSPKVDPLNESYGDKKYRVLRGGCWSFNAYFCRVATRRSYYPDFRYYYLGFRVVVLDF